MQIPTPRALMPALLRAGCEPFSIWEGIDPKSEEYRKLKEERAQVLMDAVEVGAIEVCLFFRDIFCRAIGCWPWTLLCSHCALEVWLKSDRTIC